MGMDNELLEQTKTKLKKDGMQAEENNALFVANAKASMRLPQRRR